MYKINFLNLDENDWHGSKLLKKNLKSPQWLRNLKFKDILSGDSINQKIFKLFRTGDGTLLIYKMQRISQKLNLLLMESLIKNICPMRQKLKKNG